MRVKFTCYLVLFLQFFFPSKLLAGDRIGVAISAPVGLSLGYDHLPVFSEHWSLGGEFYGAEFSTLFGAVRALYWQNADTMSGFNGGPKLGVVLGKYVGLGAGAEGGWLYRFGSGIDLGAGVDLWGSSAGLVGGVRLDCGYLF